MAETWECPECGNFNPAGSAACVRCGLATPHAPPAGMVGKQAFTADEWLCLKFAPLWVFSAVAEADGKIDDKEAVVFSSLINHSQLIEEPLLREVLGEVVREGEGSIQDYFSDQRDVQSGLTEVKEILDRRVSPSQAKEFKKMLFHIGYAVADASGGGLFGFLDRVSDEEKTVLSYVLALLGLSIEELKGEA